MSNISENLDPRVRRTRKMLKQAFIEIVQEKGFDATSVQDITDRADINRATFYAHFTDKFDLHDHMILEWFRETLTTYDVDTETAFESDNMRELIFSTCDFLQRLNSGCHPADIQYRPTIEDLIHNEIYSIVYKWLQSVNGIQNPDISAAAVSWAIFGAAMQWSRQQEHTKETVANTVMRMIDSGLRSECVKLPDLVNSL